MSRPQKVIAGFCVTSVMRGDLRPSPTISPLNGLLGEREKIERESSLNIYWFSFTFVTFCVFLTCLWSTWSHFAVQVRFIYLNFNDPHSWSTQLIPVWGASLQISWTARLHFLLCVYISLSANAGPFFKWSSEWTTNPIRSRALTVKHIYTIQPQYGHTLCSASEAGSRPVLQGVADNSPIRCLNQRMGLCL